MKITLPKDCIKITEKDGEIELEFFALTSKELDHIVDVLRIKDALQECDLEFFEMHDILDYIRDSFEAEELVDTKLDEENDLIIVNWNTNY